MPRIRHWYTRRTWKDAPSWQADLAQTTFGAWADGWNDCVEAYLRETEETLRKEGYGQEE